MLMRYRTLVLVSLLGLVLLIAAGLLRRVEADPIRMTTAEVTTGPVVRRIMVTGTLQPTRTVAIGSQISGTIQSIDADFNDNVQAGQTVARLDPSLHHARLVEAEARLAQARFEHARLQAIADDAARKLEQAEELAGDDLMPEVELDLARVTSKSAAAAVLGAAADAEGAAAAAAEARVRLSHTIIRSPIAGIVVGRHVEAGQTVAASVETPVLFTVADLRRMQLLAEVAESDVGGIRPGSTVTFRVESLGDEAFAGTVSSVRLQPVLEQAGATGASASSVPSAPVGTSGASSAQGTRSSTGQPTSQAGSAGSQSTSPATSTAAGAAATPSQPGAQSGRVVTYTAVIDVNNTQGAVPPGGTAIIELAGRERPAVVRIPNTALAFRPSAAAFAEVDQDPPILDPAQAPREKPADGLRRVHVWKFENRRFVPIAVELGLADDDWTELVSGPLRPGDVLLTSAESAKK